VLHLSVVRYLEELGLEPIFRIVFVVLDVDCAVVWMVFRGQIWPAV
jgi:hypothetical protein